MSSRDEIVVSKAVWASVTERAKVQAKQEYNARLVELTREELEALSRSCHQAHQNGVTKGEIRALLGVYNDTPRFNIVWDAITPDIHTDLRRRSRLTEPAPLTPDISPVQWRTSEQAEVTLPRGEVLTVEGQWVADGPDDDPFFEFDFPDALGDDYPVVARMIRTNPYRKET